MAKTIAPRTRAHAGGALMTYNLEGVPRALIEQARAKCRAQMPPTSVKAQLIRLLQGWVSDGQPGRNL